MDFLIIEILKENSDNPHAWYNEINGTDKSGKKIHIKSKIGLKFKVIDYDEDNYKTIDRVLSYSRGFIRKCDCKVLERINNS